ncbi:MAG: DMT family transporter [Pseudomonadota bacterium]
METASAAPRRPLLAYLLLTLTALFWAGNAVASQFAVGAVSPMLLVTLRWLGALALTLPLAWSALVADWPRLRPHLGFTAAMGAIGFTLFNALFYAAAKDTTAVNMGIIQGSMPVLVIAGAYLLRQSQVSMPQVAGVFATVLGVVTVVAQGDPARIAALDVNPGDGLMLIACLLYSGYTLGLRNRPAVSPEAFFAVMAAAAFVTSLPFLAAEAALGTVLSPTPTGWGVVAYVILFPSLFAQIFWLKGVGVVGPARAGVFINIVPVATALLAVGLLGEAFAAYHLIGLTLVLGGIWLSEWRGGG